MHFKKIEKRNAQIRLAKQDYSTWKVDPCTPIEWNIRILAFHLIRRMNRRSDLISMNSLRKELIVVLLFTTICSDGIANNNCLTSSGLISNELQSSRRLIHSRFGEVNLTQIHDQEYDFEYAFVDQRRRHSPRRLATEKRLKCRVVVRELADGRVLMHSSHRESLCQFGALESAHP